MFCSLPEKKSCINQTSRSRQHVQKRLPRVSVHQPFWHLLMLCLLLHQLKYKNTRKQRPWGLWTSRWRRHPNRILLWWVMLPKYRSIKKKFTCKNLGQYRYRLIIWHVRQSSTCLDIMLHHWLVCSLHFEAAQCPPLQGSTCPKRHLNPKRWETICCFETSGSGNKKSSVSVSYPRTETSATFLWKHQNSCKILLVTVLSPFWHPHFHT